MDVAHAPALWSLPLALAAGAVSFLSPCVAPLLPGYLAFIGGTTEGSDQPIVPRTVAFVFGFACVFTAVGVATSAASHTLFVHRPTLQLVAGCAVALMGLAFAWGRSPVPTRASAIAHRLAQPTSYAQAALVGAALGIAWTPCIGPALAGILALASTGSDLPWAASLLLAYSIGLGLPFVLAAAGLRRFVAPRSFLRTHARSLRSVCGVVMLAIGLAIASGQMALLTARVASMLPSLA